MLLLIGCLLYISIQCVHSNVNSFLIGWYSELFEAKYKNCPLLIHVFVAYSTYSVRLAGIGCSFFSLLMVFDLSWSHERENGYSMAWHGLRHKQLSDCSMSTRDQWRKKPLFRVVFLCYMNSLCHLVTHAAFALRSHTRSRCRQGGCLDSPRACSHKHSVSPGSHTQSDNQVLCS